MLKKSVVANIMPTVRRCKCGVTGPIHPTAVITRCGHCNEILYEHTTGTVAIATAPVVEPIVTQDEEPSNEDSQLKSEDTGTTEPDSAEPSDKQKDSKSAKTEKPRKRSFFGG